MKDHTDTKQAVTNRDTAVALIAKATTVQEVPQLARVTLDLAQAYAQLATADAIDRLTDQLASMSFPELTVKKCLGGLGFSVKPVTR